MKALAKLEEETKDYGEFNVQLCLDYGGRDEIVRAVNGALKKKVRKVDEETFRKFLDTPEIPDPDLVIWTSGEKRTSGILGSSKYIYNYLYHNSQQHWIHQRAAHSNYSHCPS